MGSCGFTLIELMVAIAIGAVVVALGVPSAMRAYDSMQYRDTIRSIHSAATGARYHAINSGAAHDLLLEPAARRFMVQPAGQPLVWSDARGFGGDARVSVVSARELRPSPDIAVIRFYHDGSSSGGAVSVQRDGGPATSIAVDWLLGRVSIEQATASEG